MRAFYFDIIMLIVSSWITGACAFVWLLGRWAAAYMPILIIGIVATVMTVRLIKVMYEVDR